MGADPLMAGNSQRRGRTHRRGQEGRHRRHRRQEPPVAGRPRRDPAGRGAARATPRSGGPPPRPGQRADRARARQRAEEQPELLLGRNPVVEALRARIPATALYVVTGDDRPRHRRADRRGAGAGRRPRAAAARGGQGRVRPDVAGARCTRASACRCRPTSTRTPTTCSTLARDSGRPPLIVAMDGVTDPRNLGAVVRSAAAFDAHGVVVPQRRAVGMTASAWRTSAGAAARIPVARAVNLARALAAYQDAGLQTVGLAGDGDVDLHDYDGFADPVALVVGAEGTGLSRLVRERCDVVVRIPIARDTESLNVSVAAGIALYAAGGPPDRLMIS